MALIVVGAEVQPWALALSFLTLLVRYGAEKDFWSLPRSLWSNILAVLSLALVLFQFRTFMGQEPSSTFIVLLTALRILDFKTERDEKLLIFLGFILISLKFLYSIDFYWVPIGIFICLGLWRSLLPNDISSPWKMTIRNSLRALPVVLILFFVFPRVQIPWARSFTPQMASIGFSESISPGDIASIAQSKETVMRVEFESYIPTILEMYWRGAVLEISDGFGWHKTDEEVKEFPMAAAALAYDYTVTLEPLQIKVLPVLEHTRIVMAPSIRATKTDRSTYRTSSTISTRVRYHGLSVESWSGPATKDPLALPELPPKTQEWLKAKNKLRLDYKGKLKLLKDFYTQSGFSYSRSPGTHANLDEFLFQNRLGFCEHFAGSYAILARGLGIPARVVTGYQGGEINEAGGFVRVTQEDAHAWVEVRDPKGLWKRIDPTFWIAPLRIEMGGLAYFQLSPTDFGLSAAQALRKIRNQNIGGAFWSQLELLTENINYLWVRTLLEFDLSEQQRLIEFFAPRIGWWLVLLVVLVVLYQGFKRWFRSQKHNVGPASENFLWLEKKLLNHGFTRQPHHPPVDFLRSIIALRPKDEDLIKKTISLYQFERYKERQSGPDDWDRLKRAWKMRLKQSNAKDNQGSR